jgi:site-specific DNA-methyltransferase (adenine-specific)
MDTIICGNNTDILKTFPDNYIDLVVTSPPYDNLRHYCGYTFEITSLVVELYRILQQGGVIVWVVADQTINGSESGTSFKHALLFMEHGFRLHDTMIYLKNNPVPLGGTNRYFQAFEYMFVFSKGSPKTFNPIFVPRKNKYNDKRTERIRPTVRNKNGEFTDKRIVAVKEEVKKTNVWEYAVGGNVSVENGIKHPAAFPLQLALDHIQSWSTEGDIVLDPFVGSGTTCIAAKQLHRHYIGIDISEEYCDYAKERLKKMTTLGKS